MIRAPGYREVTERVSDSDHLQMAWRERLYSVWSALSVMGLFRLLQLSLSLDNSLSAVSLHLAISIWQCVLLSFSLSAHAHTYTQTHRLQSYLYFLCAIMLSASTYRIHGTHNVGTWTTGVAILNHLCLPPLTVYLVPHLMRMSKMIPTIF